MKIIAEIFRTRRSAVLLIALLAMANAALFGDYFLRQAPEIDRARATLIDKSRFLSRAASSGQTSLYTQGQTDLTTFRSGIPPKKDFAKTVGELYERASADGLSVGGTTFKSISSGEAGFVSYLLSMDISGKYPGIKRFLAELQNLPQSIVVEKVSLTGSNGKGETGMVNLRLDLTLFLQKEGQ